MTSGDLLKMTIEEEEKKMSIVNDEFKEMEYFDNNNELIEIDNNNEIRELSTLTITNNSNNIINNSNNDYILAELIASILNKNTILEFLKESNKVVFPWST